MRTYPLPIEDSVICLVFAASTMLWGFLFKALPAVLFSCLVRKEKKIAHSSFGESSFVSHQW